MFRNLSTFKGQFFNQPADAFLCVHCGNTVPGDSPGTRHRNHCPRCLRSLHVDITAGDRRSLCKGIMDPISAWVRHGEEVSLLHRCQRCGLIRSNRIAGDDDPEPLRDLFRLLEVAVGSIRGPVESVGRRYG